jgi:AcrR family transcriptional regulator
LRAIGLPTLIRQRGASATSLDDILAHSGAPRGSLYCYFPGGRNQLIEETVELAGASIEQLIASAGDHSPIEVFDAFVKAWRDVLIASSFQAGCPVLAVAIETDNETPQLTEAAARVHQLAQRTGRTAAPPRCVTGGGAEPGQPCDRCSGRCCAPQPRRTKSPALDDAARALRPLLQRTTAPHSKKS